MSKQARDVTGGDKMMVDVVPGWGALRYVLGIFTVPVETFLRFGFGERYYSWPSFLGGLILLYLIKLAAYLIGLFFPFASIIALIFGRSGAGVESWLDTIIWWYTRLGLLHFLVIWFRNVIGTPVHSFSAGKSWLRPIGRGVMFVLNLLLNQIVRLIFLVNPYLDKRRLVIALPVLQDEDIFTERYIEPAFVMVFGYFAAGAGQSTVFFTCVLSAMALNVYTGMRHERQRDYWLDIQDSMLEAGEFQKVKSGEVERAKASHKRMVKKAALEAEVNPDMVPIIERSNPTLADAMRAVSPQLRKMVNPDPAVTQAQQAA